MYPYYDEDQSQLAEAVSRMAADQPQDGGDHWDALVALGLPALGMPEAFGGSDAGGRGYHAVLETLGRHGLASPFVASALCCTRLLMLCATAAQKEQLLPALADGSLVLALASGEAQTDFRLASVQASASADGDGWQLQGRKTLVVNGGQANAWIVTARTGEGELALFMVRDGLPGVQVRRFPCIDGSEGCDLDLDAVRLGPGDRIGAAGQDVLTALEDAVDAAVAGQCAESIGIQAALLETTVAYARERRQFGAAIGSFQVVQHRLVDMLVALEQARSLAWLAASVLDGGDACGDADERGRLVSAAKVRCIESGRLIGLQAIHLHGGMGMTAELPVGRWVKRLLAIEHSFGDERHHLSRFAHTP